MVFSLLLCLIWLSWVVADVSDYKIPPDIYEASEYTTWSDKSVGGSKRAEINIDLGEGDYIHVYRLDLVGTAKERGFAHGALMAHEIYDFMYKALPAWYSTLLPGDLIDGLPEHLQEALKKAEGKGLATLANKAMYWVYEQEFEYMPQEMVDEMEAIAEGVCSVRHGAFGHCNTTEIAQTVKTVNMLPELVRMACTAYGAWGDATAKNPTPGSLIQVRALDFGTGPFVNYTVVQTNRHENENKNNFISVSFPGFVGSITGMSQNGIAISEKVWMQNGKKNLQYGRYDGIPDVFALRHILEYSANRQDAEDYLRSVTRTFAIFAGVGDYETGKFDLIGYKRQSVHVYDDQSIHEVTEQPVIKDVCYVDKHPQPSTDEKLPSVLQDLQSSGNLTMENARVVTQYHETGDVHIGVYDFDQRRMLLSIGKINSVGNYMPEGTDDNTVWKAYNRPYMQFNLDELFQGK